MAIKKPNGQDSTRLLEPHNVRAGEIRLPHPGVISRSPISKLAVDTCRKLLEGLTEMLRDGELSVSDDSSTRMTKLTYEMTKGKKEMNLTRDDLAELYSSFSRYLSNILAVAKADRRYDKAWRRIITDFDVESTDLRKELGREPYLKMSYGWNNDIIPEALFFPVRVTNAYHWYNRKRGDYEVYGRLTLGATDRRTLADLFFGKDFAARHLYDTLPEGNSLTIEDFEHATVTDLMTLDGVALNGSLLGANGSMSAAAVKKVKGKTSIADFACQSGKWDTDRVEMLCLTYFTYLDYSKSKTAPDVRKLAKFAVESMPGLIVGPIFNTFLPAWQGFTKTWTSESYVDDVTKAVNKILTGAAGEWIGLDNFRMQLMCSDVESAYGDMRCLCLFPYYRGREKAALTRRADKESGADKKKKEKDLDWFEDIGFKFALHWIKYLCALGMAELAVDAAAVDSDPMEGMRFARLTPLGRYAFGIDMDYTPKAAEVNSSVEFDPRNGIITVDANSPYRMFLSNIAKKISPTRFGISTESLLKGCRWESELDHRIKNLRTILDPDREPALQKMIGEALSHTDCVEREGGYSLLKLRPDLPELRQLLLTDKELRELTIMAGPYLALVKTSKLERFNTILAANGYLVD